MLLYDVGNTNIKCYENGKIANVEDFDNNSIFYYINVNPKMRDFKNGIDLEPYFKLKTSYVGLGVDRKAVCCAVDDGVIVDAGSAITVDVMSEGFHKGGFILPGILAYKESFAKISTTLIFDVDENIDIKKLPKNSDEALNFAIFNSIYLMIKDVSKDKKLYFTGGDGKMLSKNFEGSVYKKDLVFTGMKRVIKEMGC